MIRITLTALFCSLLSFTGCPLAACEQLTSDEAAALVQASDESLLTMRAGQETGETVTETSPYQPQIEAQKQQEQEAAAAAASAVVIVVVIVVMMVAMAGAAAA